MTLLEYLETISRDPTMLRQGLTTLADASFSAFNKTIAELVRRPFALRPSPPALSHYTSFAGFEGIISSQTVWCTHHKDLDDQNELLWLEKAMDDTIARLQGNTKGPARVVLEKFASEYKTKRLGDITDVGIRCFSRLSDSREQWDFLRRADGGQGICIVMPTLMEDRPTYFGGKCGEMSAQVLYDQREARELVEQGFKSILDAFNDAMTRWPVVDQNELGYRAMIGLAEIAGLAGTVTKGAKFRVEAEWRHAIIPEHSAQVTWQSFQTTDGRRRRYLALPLRRTDRMILIERVIVRDKDPETVARVEEVLRRNGYGSNDVPMPPVVSSEHPL